MTTTGTIELRVERAVAGGRMLARHDGAVVLVSGAIPGERVLAELERSARQVQWARTVEVLEASPHRRESPSDPTCGGLAYAHVQYEHQRRLKSDVIVDAFRRVGKMTVGPAIAVEPSPERGYRLRARLHVRDGRAGFFREGAHVLCDAASTGQLSPETTGAVAALLERLGPRSRDCDAVTVAENVPASERVLHIEPRPGARFADLRGGALPPAVTGVTTTVGRDLLLLAGAETVTDTARTLVGDASPIPADTTWRRRPTSFFQGNRFLTGALVRRVIALGQGDRIADLYAGVGLFAAAFAAMGASVVAVEGDASSARDLRQNAVPWPARLRVVESSVEDAAPRLGAGAFDAVALDPPRTGVSAKALDAVLALGAPRLVYVSCDPATLARDAARIVAARYVLTSVEAFDVFPNTAHIEMIATFDRA